jgi:hypothetical protein
MAATGTPYFRHYAQTRNHIKLDRLGHLLGIPKVYAHGHMSALWCWAAEAKPDGVLGHRVEDIEWAAEWSGPPGKFVAACVACRLLDHDDEGYYVHNWLLYAESYVRAQRAANRRIAERNERLLRNSDGTVTEPSRHSSVTVPQNGSDRIGSDLKPMSSSPSEPDPGASASLIEQTGQVHAHYRHYHPRVPATLDSTSKEAKAIRARLKAGWSVADLCLAIDGCHQTPHNLGQNERGQKYLGLELIMRTCSQVQRFVEHAQRGTGRPGPRPEPTGAKRPAAEVLPPRLTAEEAEASRATGLSVLASLRVGLAEA